MLLAINLLAQADKTQVSFYSSDDLLITADEFITSDSLPYVILIHDQGSSRGEFSDIINRFQKMNFNCLSVDIRNGGSSNYLANETAKRCRTEGFNTGVSYIQADITAAIKYVFEKSGEKVILLGAGANGSLVLKTSKESPFVRAAIALSPGEFFQPHFKVEDVIAGIEKPLLITSSRVELPYQKAIVSKVDDKYKTIVYPAEDEGERGTRALLQENASAGEYWLGLLLFFKDLQ